MPRPGMEPWQNMFHNDWERAQEKRNASLPDYGDMYLYDEGDDDGDS